MARQCGRNAGPEHPHAYTTFATPQLSSLAYDGLVAYRRVEGPAGGTLVGALATTAPPPSRDGKTYVFTLRPGLRYSDGRPVRPTDFRASMERFLHATSTYPPETFPTVYDSIVGGRRCRQSKAPCDLSRGIETDVPTRTITIHLVRPDSDLLHKLTMAFAFVVPADSPRRATSGRPPPGTGPYRVVNWDAHRGGTLVRNRYFRSAPARSRGEGFADRIEVRVHGVKTTERQIAEVQRGAADIAVVANRGWRAPDIERARQLVAASGRAVERIVVRVPDFRLKVGRYYASVLEDLGFRTSLAGADLQQRRRLGPAHASADGLRQLGRRLPRAVDVPRNGLRVRRRRGLNLAKLCDRRLDRLIDRALDTPPAEATAVWAAADHRLTDVAAAVPLTHRRSVVLVSRRVGNVKTHAQWFTLLDQMWVR